MNDTSFPRLEWRAGNSKNGVTLRTHGNGKNLFIFPGMEGSGESCMHLVAPVVEQASKNGAPYRLVLVDYANEKHETLDELLRTIHELIAKEAGQAPCFFWAQSFGNLLGTGLAGLGGINVEKFVLVSPFTALPVLRVHLSTLAMYVTPTFVYRLTSGLFGRYLFGPVGEQSKHPFFDALRRGTSGVVRRRTGWLRSRDFSEYFKKISSPSKVWLGMQDRLVDLKAQRDFFAELADTRSNYRLSMIAGCGHVVLPDRVTLGVQKELLQWLHDDR